MLDVNMICLLVPNHQQLPGICRRFASAVDLQLYSEIARPVPVEDGDGLVTVWMDQPCRRQSGEAGITVGMLTQIIRSSIAGGSPAQQRTASVAACIEAIVAIPAENGVRITEVVRFPYSAPAFPAESCISFLAVPA